MGSDNGGTWAPRSIGIINKIGRALSIPSYLALAPFSIGSWAEATVENAKWWRAAFAAIGIPLALVCHMYVWQVWDQAHTSLFHGLAQVGVFLFVDYPYSWLFVVSHCLIQIIAVDRKASRLKAGKLKGSRVVVIGNGPSALEGEELGHLIDGFDEVVRFNNFQTKVAGMEKWVGTKTTVHFSDGVLYPTYQEYHVPGATIVLSLFVDRYMVAGSYLILRMAADLEFSLVMNFFMDPETNWIEKNDIERLKGELGLQFPKHPTSGMLAIDHFLHQKNAECVYIHGFDFFMGPKMHYFDEQEPLYERINDKVGVNMHSPKHEKVFVEKLIADGKVKWLKDLPKESGKSRGS